MLPDPLPDDPRKWDGWSRYNSKDYYERLCLSFDSRPTAEQIEEHSRVLQVWWQKKLPLKNQPSNPLAQMLRGGMDLAPRYIAEARAELLNPERRAQIDADLQAHQRENALTEFKKFLDFALSDFILTLEEEANLLKLGRALGLGGEDIAVTIEKGLGASGAKRETLPAPTPVPVAAEVSRPAPIAPPADDRPRTRRVRANTPKDEFWRMLQLSGLDSESMSDERRDTFIDMAENMGLDPGEAEDLVDDYLEAIENGTLQVKPRGGADAPTPLLPVPVTPKPATNRVPAPVVKPPQTPLVSTVTLNPAEERRKYQDFVTSLGTEMRFIPSAAFTLGNGAPGAPVNEQPPTRVTVSRYFMSRYPITNGEYERFDPAHGSRRGAWADERHPVIYVSSLEAIRFCQWLSLRERKKFRLPTEAEWEFAAKGAEGFVYPWGDATGLGTLANFADANTTFAWRDPNVNDGYAETSPVGSYPSGKSRANIEDLAGNVWEWCQDWYGNYTGRECVNPQGPKVGTQRVYRGGSWKSRFASLKTTSRGYNLPGYASNDVGFRIVCECD